MKRLNLDYLESFAVVIDSGSFSAAAERLQLTQPAVSLQVRQLEKSLENLAAALASAGASLDQVGALRLYVKESHMREGRAIGDALKAAFGDNPPCATWIGVPSLADPDFLVEVEPSVVFLPTAP